jgi:hypothetical protein
VRTTPIPTWLELQDSRAFPVATVAIVAVTIVVTLVQIAVPELRLHLWRDQGALESGEFWRLATPLLIQYDPWRDAAIVLGLIAFVGTAVERVYGAGRLLVIYVTCGVVGQACGYLWEPPDAGASVAGAGLLGALSAWLLSPRSGAPLPARLIAVVAVAHPHRPPGHARPSSPGRMCARSVHAHSGDADEPERAIAPLESCFSRDPGGADVVHRTRPVTIQLRAVNRNGALVTPSRRWSSSRSAARCSGASAAAYAPEGPTPDSSARQRSSKPS